MLIAILTFNIIIIAIVLVPPFLEDASAQRSAADSNGQIAFETNIDNSRSQIYVMNPDGSNQHNISNNPADGSYQRNLSNNETLDKFPNWAQVIK